MRCLCWAVFGGLGFLLHGALVPLRVEQGQPGLRLEDHRVGAEPAPGSRTVREEVAGLRSPSPKQTAADRGNPQVDWE